jgi:hypothetical protein
MKIIGFTLNKISIERKEHVEGKLEIKQNIDIAGIEKEKVPISKYDVFRIKFKFNINYNQDLANLEFNGNVMILPDKNEVKEFVLASKEKQIPEEFRIPIFNFIMAKCNIKALNLEDEINLPLHIPLPKLNSKKN